MTTRLRLFTLVAVLLCVAVPVRAQKAPLVAAASDLRFALESIAHQFTRESGARVELVFGSSGMLTRQIIDGAPFELFLSADEAFVQALAGAGLTRDGGALYAVGRIVIFAPHGSPLKVDENLEGLRGLLARRGVSRFAIANPSMLRMAGRLKRHCAPRAFGNRSRRRWCSAKTSDRPRNSPRPATPSAACWRTRSCSLRRSVNKAPMR